MNAAQVKKYWREWGAVKRSLGSHCTREDAEALRVEITRKVGAVSSTKFTESQFTHCLREFRLISNPDFLDQLNREETAAAQSTREGRILWRIGRALDAIAPQNRNAYVAGVAGRLGVPPTLAACDWSALRSLWSSLEKTAKNIPPPP